MRRGLSVVDRTSIGARPLVAAGALVVLTVSGFAAQCQAATPLPTCAATQLRLRAGLYGEAGGQFMQTFTATNSGARSCRVAGWPNIQTTSPSGRNEAAPSIRVVQGRPSSHPFVTVTIKPGGAASFDLFGADWDALANRACPKTHALAISLPGVRPLPVTVALPFCGPFYVAPLVAGKSDRESWSGVWAKRWCRIQQFTVSVGPRISEATGQHTLALRLRNHGDTCTIYGRPALWFKDAHGLIPFGLRIGTDQMIAAPYPLPVKVRSDGSAWIVINHYRCDLGDKRAANVVRIGLQDATYSNATDVTIGNPYQRVDYCGKGDPGSTITVAPFEPSLRAAFQR